MRNIWMLTLANFRKNKGQTISLLVFILIAAMLLNIGIIIFLDINSFFDERAEKNHAAHFTAIYQDGADGIDSGLQYMKNHPDVVETEVLNVVGGQGDFFIDGTKSPADIYFSAADKTQRMDPPSLVGESRPLSGDAVYIPYFMMMSGDYKVGDDFKLNLSETALNFTVAGATEEFMFGAQNNALYRFYVSDEKYNELEKQFPEHGITMISARLKSNHDTIFFQADYNKKISLDGLAYDITLDNAKTTRTMIPMIVAIIVMVFAMMLLVVSLIVVRFRIINSIEESMTNIGVQKAIGYRSVQITSSIIAQFGLVTLLGSIMGIAMSQAVIPAIMNILEPLLALVWNPRFDIVKALFSVAVIVLVVVCVSFVSAQRISKLHPLIALRGGITTHSFKKNAFPLDQSYGALNVLLALKQLLQNKKQAFTISVIVAAVTMASVAGIALNHNMNKGRENFARSIFGEMSDVAFVIKDKNNGGIFKEKISEYNEVRKVFGYEQGVTLLVDEVSISTTVVEDCSLLEGSMLIDGRYPKHKNEIALGPSIAKVTGKNIGDKVMVKSSQDKKEYLITGIVQFMNQAGFNGIIAGSGLCEIEPDFKFTAYLTYLNEDIDTKVFIDKVKASEGDMFDTVIEVREQLNVTMNGMTESLGIVAISIVTVTVVVIILTLYMVIKTMILRQRKELGIQKALGFTTFQLMNQIALNTSPIILIGVIVGTVVGYFGFNPMFTLIMSSMGIVKTELPVPLDQTVIVCVALIALSYAVSMLIAWKIRKISAYLLISE